MQPSVVRGLFVCSLLICFGWIGPEVHAQLVINPIFDSSITNDPNAATIESTINSAIQVYETTLANPITVSIYFQEGTGLGSNVTHYSTITYSQYLNALKLDATSPDDFTALAHLQAGPNNPVNGNTKIDVTTANLRALGFKVFPPQGSYDSTITLNTSIMNLTRPDADPNKFDLKSAAMHEIDEALGLGSALNGLPNNPIVTPSGDIRPEDLFRYTLSGARTLTTDPNAQAYFSIDGGKTDLARFNQNAAGDFGDWYSPGGQTPQVQDAFATAGAAPNPGVELTALDVIGYNLTVSTSVPELSTFGILGLGMGGMALLLRRRT